MNRPQYHPLKVRDVVRETADAISIVLDVPAELADVFQYRSGQYCVVRLEHEGEEYLRCYSMSSAPIGDEPLKTTVKRVPGGVVSNWLNDHVKVGDTLELSEPAGVFLMHDTSDDLVGFAGGSGITPVLSMIKTALATTDRRVRLLYANRDRDNVILAADLQALEARYPDRLQVTYRFDAEHGFLDAAGVAGFIADASGVDAYICGPAPFMDLVEQSLQQAGVPQERISLERFAITHAVEEETGPVDAEITIKLRGKKVTTQHRAGNTLLDTARWAGLKPPFSCEGGSCATCMAKLVKGSATMRVNNALTAAEVEEGWVLTCQALPTSAALLVDYDA